jgi:hypothetical protein
VKAIAIFCVFLFSIVCSSDAQVKTQKEPTGSSIGKLKVYPQKAVTYANIYIDWNEKLPFTIIICDSAGNAIKQWNEGPIASYQKAFYVNQLTDGLYIIKAKNARGELEQRFTVNH